MKLNRQKERIESAQKQFPELTFVYKQTNEGGIWDVTCVAVTLGFIRFDHQGYVEMCERAAWVNGKQFIQWVRLRARFLQLVRYLIEESVGHEIPIISDSGTGLSEFDRIGDRSSPASDSE